MEDGIHYHGDCGPIYLIYRHNMRGVPQEDHLTFCVETAQTRHNASEVSKGVVPRLGGFHTVGEMIHLWYAPHVVPVDEVYGAAVAVVVDTILHQMLCNLLKMRPKEADEISYPKKFSGKKKGVQKDEEGFVIDDCTWN